MTQEPTYTLTGERATTHLLMDKFNKEHDLFVGAAVARVFEASWYAQLSVEEIVATVKAMNRCLDNGYLEENTRKCLRKMVSEKVLRRVVVRGISYYEVNY